MAYLRCSEEIHKQVKREAAERETSMQDLVSEAWACYQKTEPQSPSKDAGSAVLQNSDKPAKFPSPNISEQFERLGEIIRIAHAAQDALIPGGREDSLGDAPEQAARDGRDSSHDQTVRKSTRRRTA